MVEKSPHQNVFPTEKVVVLRFAFLSSILIGRCGSFQIDKTNTPILGWLLSLLAGLIFLALFLLSSAPSVAAPIHVLFERDADGSAGNELAVVSYPTLDALINNTSSFTQFTQVDVSAAFSVGGITYDGTAYRVLFERDADGSAGNELAVVSYPTLDALINNTSSFTQFSQVDVSAAFSVGGITYDGTAYRVLFERDADGSAGNELAVVSYPTLDALINNTSSFTQFTQVDVSAAFSVGGFAYDSGVYRVLFERDADGSAGNELAVVSYPTLDALINNTSSFTQFTQVDVSAAFSVSGFYFEAEAMGDEQVDVDEPNSVFLFALGLVSLAFAARLRLASGVVLTPGRLDRSN